MTEEQLKKGAQLKALIDDISNHLARAGEFKNAFDKDVHSLYVCVENENEDGSIDKTYFYPQGKYIDMKAFASDYMQNVAKHLAVLQKQFDEL